jgi:hypothetical protein
MKKVFGLIAVMALASLGCSSVTTHIDYDRSADFGSYQTFGWADTPETSIADTSPLMHARVKRAIETRMIRGGMEEVPDDPDLWVTYHTDEKQELSLNTTTYGYGYGSRMYWNPYWNPYWRGGVGHSETTVRSYTRGTLIIDAWDAKTKNLVWRGTVEAVVSENPEKDAKMIEKAIDKMTEEWRKKRSKL